MERLGLVRAASFDDDFAIYRFGRALSLDEAFLFQGTWDRWRSFGAPR
jgi:hypothetical protein